MPQQAVEVILARQLSNYLAMPIFLVDPDGTLLFYNEPAEAILGQRFDETGAMDMSEWSTVFKPTDDEGQPVPREKLALAIALTQRRPAHHSLWIRGLDHTLRHIEVTAFPLVGQAGRFLGAVALFWEIGP
jgi:PAS domain-containing protein